MAHSSKTHPRSSGEEPPRRGPRGLLVAGRYELLRRLGAGGHGEVWQALDRLAREDVAVKLFGEDNSAEPARVRREVSALRLLRIPGVVRLVDEGVDEGRPFLVMELVQGTPFPGALRDAVDLAPTSPASGALELAPPPVDPRGTRRLGGGAPWRWQEIAGAAVALLEVLARIHAQGVVHRDLKPANVLVTADGRPTVLDFGLSLGTRLAERLTAEDRILGTPAYLAPEQISGEPVGVRADLFAVGVMLYEALAGRLPQDGASLHALLYARLTQRPRPLGDVAPDVPAAVKAAVDQLLERRPEDRPRSAAEVLSMLRGEPVAHLTEPALPRLGGEGPVRAIVDAARAGRSIVVTGPPGSGRSRCLHDAAAILQAEGRRVGWTRPGRLPLVSLEALLGPFEEEASRALDEVTAAVELRLREALAAGLVVLADEHERLDGWSAATLARCRGAGSIVEVIAEASAPPEVPLIRLAPLDEAALGALFAGPDRLFHLRVDAARALWARTAGLPARVRDEVSAWVRSGIARWTQEGIVIDRDAIDRVEAGLRVAPPLLPHADAAGAGRLSPHLEDLLMWIVLAWPNTSASTLNAAAGLPPWRAEAMLEELLRLGAAARLPDGRIEPRVAVDAEQSWSPERRRAAHRRLAALLPAGAHGRLLHLIAGQEGEALPEALEIAVEATAAARGIAAGGRLGHAVALLSEGLIALRRSRDPDSPAPVEEERLLSLWAEVALAEGTAHALDRVLYEICRLPVRIDALADLEALVRAALATVGGGGARALAAAGAVPRLAEADLERRRQGLRVLAARGCDPAREREVLEEVAAWAEGAADPRARVSLAGWLGRLRYREGRFEDAAALHAAAAEGEPWVTDRLFEVLAGASCLLEAFRHREAAERARVALDLCRSCRHPYYEARAEWLLRAAAYRMGETCAPDLDLVDAVARLGAPALEPLVDLTEAAVAWRAGDEPCARALAGQAHRLWLGRSIAGGALLARCLAVAAGAEAEPREIAALARQAATCPVPGIGAQALGLLSVRRPGARPPGLRVLGRLLRGVPRPCWGLRMDILSPAESLSMIGVPIDVAARAALRAARGGP